MALSHKDVYDQIGESLRYYLDWRAKLLTGYFAALAVSFTWAARNAPALAFLIPVLGAAASLLFWLLDVRNRDGYNSCVRAGHLRKTRTSTALTAGLTLRASLCSCGTA